MTEDKFMATGLGAKTVLLGCMSVLALSVNNQEPCMIGDILSPLVLMATAGYGYATASVIKDIIKSKQTQR